LNIMDKLSKTGNLADADGTGIALIPLNEFLLPMVLMIT